MERFVFVAAVTGAIIFGVVAMVGHGHFGIEIDGDGGFGAAPVVQAAPGRMEASVFSGGGLRIRHAAAHIVITPEDRQDFSVEIDNPGAAPMPTVSSDEGRVIIDGQLRGRVGRCLEDGGADLRGYGEIAGDRLPRITIRAPRSLVLSISGAGVTEVGPTEALDLDFSGCGVATLADVTGPLSLDFAGSGRIQGGAARSLTVDVAGSGDAALGAVSEGAEIDLAGSGDVTLASLNGDFSTDSAGSGQVSVLGGAIRVAKVDLAGSGGVDIAAPVQRLEAAIVSSGDIDVQGEVGEIDADLAGSGSVNVRVVTGGVRKEVVGAGDVNIGVQATPDAP